MTLQETIDLVAKLRDSVSPDGTYVGSRADLVHLITKLRENRDDLALVLARGDEESRGKVREMYRLACTHVGIAEGWLQVLDFVTLDAGLLGRAVEAGIEGDELAAIVSQVSEQTLATVSRRPTHAGGAPSRHHAGRRRYSGGMRG